MRLYIVRHGKATDADLTDFDRALTPRGEAQAEFLAARITTADPRPEVILSSRFPRAIQTARVIQKSVGCPLQMKVGLEVDHSVGEAIDLIERAIAAGQKSLMLVGHNPQLGELLGVLASGLPAQEMILKTGELIALEFRSQQMIGTARIVGRLRQCPDKNDESIVGGVFATATTGFGR